MTNPRVQLKNLPEAPLTKQMLAMGLVGVAGLLVFLIIAFVGRKSSSLMEASRDFDPRIALPPGLTKNLPQGVSATTLLMRPKTMDQPVSLDLTRGFILSDQEQRLSGAFRIPSALKKETALWFDLLTKYSRETSLVIREGDAPTILEEWTNDKLIQSLGDGPSTSKVNRFLRQRVKSLSRTNVAPIKIQTGLLEEFESHLNQNKKWIPSIEGIFETHDLSRDLARLFLVPSQLTTKDHVDPWGRLRPELIDRYLLRNERIDETRSPLKVARVLATLMKKQKRKTVPWKEYFENYELLEPAFLATLHAEAYWSEWHPDASNWPVIKDVKAYKLERPISVGKLLKQLKIKQNLFFSSNPDIILKNKETVLPASYVFFIAK